MGSKNSKDVITMKEAFQARGYEYNNEIIGFGGNGLICEVEKDNIKYAAKLQIINKKKKKLIRQENNILEELQDSEYIIQILDIFQYNDDSGEKLDVIVMEKMDVDLMEIIENNLLSLQLRKWIFYQICKAIQFCHSKSIWHLDIKADNVLVNMNRDKIKIKKNNYYKKENIIVKLIDFGHARRIGDRKIPRKTGTDEYSPPEVIKCKEKYFTKSFRGDKVDIWCLGVLLFTLMTGYFPYKVDKEGERMYHLIGGNLNRFIDDEECRDLLEKILCEDPNMRCSIDEIISHPWFNIL